MLPVWENAEDASPEKQISQLQKQPTVGTTVSEPDYCKSS